MPGEGEKDKRIQLMESHEQELTKEKYMGLNNMGSNLSSIASPIDAEMRKSYDTNLRTSSAFSDQDVVKGVGKFKTAMAVCKGYCAINILVLTKNFEDGGWVTGVLSIFGGCFLVLICALKLVECGSERKIYSFTEIALAAFGPKGKLIVDVFIMLCQFSFTVAQISFTLENLVQMFGEDENGVQVVS